MILFSLLMYVTCQFSGQLGNQLFEIATTLAYAWEYQCEAIFPQLHRTDSNLSYNKDRIFFRLDSSSLPTSPTYYQENNWHTYTKIPFVPDVILHGYFQSWRYFDSYRDRILEVFAPSETVEQYLEEKYGDLIAHPKTVAVHVRTFSATLHSWKTHPFIGLDYYEKAIKLFDPQSLFVIFSDRIPWCKRHFAPFCPNVVFIEGNDHVEDIFLMSKMKDFIIGNSSFAWWGAYMAQNETKRVVAPNTWVHPDYLEFSLDDLLPKEWVKVPVVFKDYPQDMTYCNISQSLDGN